MNHIKPVDRQDKLRSLSDLFHVSVALHGDNSTVILLIHPDEEVLSVVMPDSTSVRPVSVHLRGGKQRRYRLIKQEVIFNKLLLIGISHRLQRVVFTCECYRLQLFILVTHIPRDTELAVATLYFLAWLSVHSKS